jgi:hypothetical protein
VIFSAVEAETIHLPIWQNDPILKITQAFRLSFPGSRQKTRKIFEGIFGNWCIMDDITLT